MHTALQERDDHPEASPAWRTGRNFGRLMKGPVLGRIGSLEVRLARSEQEVAAAQEVRFRVFYDELGARRSACLLYTSPSPRDGLLARMPSSA